MLATLALNDENQDTTTSCDNCDESQTFETRCQDCGKFLCHYCTEFHRRCRESRSHVLLSKIELKSNKPADNARILNCVKHKENIKFYCKTCQMTSCMVCTVVDHRSHEVSSVEESACDAKSELKQLAENVKAMGNRATESIENLKEEARNINASNQNAYDEINSFFKDLEKEIENQRAKLIKKAISSINYQKEQLQASTRNLETLRDACCSGVKFAEEALEHGSDVQVLRMKNTIAQRLKSLKFDKDEKKPWVGKPIRFSNHCSLEDVRNIITELCFVEDVVACPEESLAYFKDSGRFLHVGERSVIEIVLKDKNGEIIRSGTGRNRIESSFSGVQVSDVRVAESEKGFHDISFVANQVGTLKFEAKINGSLSLGCCLENDSKWLLSCTHGCGQILNGGHTMIGEGDIGKYCYRLGD